MINLLLLNNFYPVIYRRGQNKSDELSYTVWPLVTVRNQLPAQVVKYEFPSEGTVECKGSINLSVCDVSRTPFLYSVRNNLMKIEVKEENINE